jgi:hypothetical protein
MMPMINPITVAQASKTRLDGRARLWRKIDMPGSRKFLLNPFKPRLESTAEQEKKRKRPTIARERYREGVKEEENSI